MSLLNYNIARYCYRAALWLMLAVFAFLFIAPVAVLLLGMFRDAPPGMTGNWTLGVVSAAFTDRATFAAFANSLIYAVVTTLIAAASGALFAFLSVRANIRLRWLITPVMVLLFAAPNLFYAISWGLLADPYAGLLNEAFRFITDSDQRPFNAYSWTGLIVVQSLKLTGFCYLILLGPFMSMNRSLEEASLVAGASRASTFFRINLPLMAPTLFGIMIIGIVFGLGTFDIPQILGGLPQIPVLSTEIFKAVNFSVPPDYSRASSLSLFMIVALLVLLMVQWKMLKAGRFVTVTGKSGKQDRWDIGGWGYLATAIVVVFTLVALVLPIAQLIITSFQPALGVYDFTWRNYEQILKRNQTFAAFCSTAELAAVAGFIAMCLATLAAYVGQRANKWVDRYLETVTLLPLIVPGVVLAIGLIWVYLSVPGLKALYATRWLALVGLVVVVMPIASRAISGAVVQIARELEEAAMISGAGPIRVFKDVVLKLLKNSFLTGWLVTSILAAGALEVPLMLLPSLRPNVAVLVYSRIASGDPTQASALLVLLLIAIAALAIAAGLLISIFRRPAVAR